MAAKMAAVCFSSLLLMLLVVMTSARTSSSSMAHSEDGHVTGGGCVLRPDFHTQRVIPLWEAEARVQGCHVGHTPPNLQEVHVIHVRENPDDGREPPSVVTVHVRRGLNESHAPFVLVLHSDYTVSWRLLGQRGDNQSHRIFVTQGSQVIEVKDMKVVIRRRQNEVRVARLVDWVKKRFKMMTSYSRLEYANHVYLKLGHAEVSAKNTSCNVKTRNVAPNMEAFLQEPVPPSKRRGCVSNGTPLNSNTEVHVIKIDRPGEHLAPHWGSDSSSTHDPAHPTPEVPHVIIALQSRTGPRVDRDVVLVLKSREPVIWKLSAENVYGKIEILTENVVEISKASSSTSLDKSLTVSSETLPEDSAALVGLVADRFGLAFTFNEVLKANKILVMFEATYQMRKMFPPTTTKEPPLAHRYFATGTAARSVGPDPYDEDVGETFSASSFRGSRIISAKDLMQAHLDTIRMRDAGGLSGSGGPRAPPGTHSLVKSGAPVAANDVIRMPNVVLMEAMTVECLPRHMQVSFPRLTLERIGIEGEDVSLNDTRCRIQNNETHIVLATVFHRCGTRKEVMHNRMRYINMVRFHFHTRKLGSSAADMDVLRGAGFTVDDEDNFEGSGFPPSTPKPQEDSEMRALQFQCDYLGTQDEPAAEHDEHGATLQRDFVISPPEASMYNMEVYRDEDYNQAVLPVEYPMTATEHDAVYVETRLDSGSPLRVVTESCWLTNNSDPLVTSGPRVGLLHHTCPTSANVKVDRLKVHPFGQVSETPMPPYDRFSFQLLSNFAQYEGLFIHCRLGVCSEDATVNHNDIRTCVDPKVLCNNPSRPFHDHSVGSHHIVLSRGPIHVLTRPPPPKLSHVGLKSKEEKEDWTHTEIKCTVPEQRPIFINGLSTEAVVGIAFAAFIIGTVLSAIMWCIYLRTDPLRATHQAGQKRATQHNSGYDLSANSGSSTPNSHSPITA